MDCSLPSFSIHGIFQARILEWVAISSSRRSSPPTCWTRISSISCIVGRFFTPHTTWKLLDNLLISLICVHAKSLQLCPTLCDPMDCSPQGSSVHGIVQARILEWVAISSSRRSSPPRARTWVSYIANSLPSESPGKPIDICIWRSGENSRLEI